MKKLAMVALASLLFLIASCGVNQINEISNNTESDLNSMEKMDGVQESDTVQVNDYPRIEEIEWKFRDSVQNDTPVAVLDYTNNSRYTILELDFQFKMKDNVSSEQLQLINPITNELVTDEEVAEMKPYVYDTIVCDPGEKGEGANCFMQYNTNPSSTDQCDLMELTSLDIRFIGDDGKGHTVSYSAENGGYSLSPVSDELYTWVDNDYSQMIPKPDTRVASADQYEDNCLGVKAYDMDHDAYMAYVDDCEQQDFENMYPDEDHDYSYSGKNAGGYEVHIRYIDYMHCVELTLKKSE